MNENIKTTGDENLKAAIANLKNNIANLAEKQRIAKPQRKTVHFQGERTMSAYDAEMFVRGLKRDLRFMYAAYGLLRGKRFEVTENNDKEFKNNGVHSLQGWWEMQEVNYVLKKYGYEIPKKDGKFIEDYEKIVRVSE